eukprot:RCo005116
MNAVDENDCDGGKPLSSYPLFSPALARVLADGPDLVSHTLAHPLLQQWARRGAVLPKSYRMNMSRRYRGNDAVLRAPRSQPAWFSQVTPVTRGSISQSVQKARVVRTIAEGSQALQREFQKQHGSWITEQLNARNMNVTYEEANISVRVVDRFMERCLEFSDKGVFPRLVFHGTKQANLSSIERHGLLTPAHLHPEGWYTPAIWTATEPQISVGYSDHCAIFGCAVLDDTSTGRSTQANEAGTTVKGVLSRGPVERQWGRHQHRLTKKPSGPPGRRTSPRRNVRHLGQNVVLVYNERHICPLFTIRYKYLPKCDPVGEARSRLPRANVNTTSPDHGNLTRGLAVGADLTYMQCPLEKQLYQRALRRSRDIHLRGLHDKRANFCSTWEL